MAEPLDLASVPPGSRLVLRWRMPDGVLTDTVGRLVRLEATLVHLDSDKRGPVQVPRAAITHAKRVPDRAVPRRDRAALDRVLVDSWAPVEREERDGWLLRAAGGFTRRANSALQLGPVSPGSVAGVVEPWYRERGLRPVVALSHALGTAPDPWLVAALEDAGWARDVAATAMTVEAAAARAALAASGSEVGPDGVLPAGTPLQLTAQAPDDWVEALAGRRGVAADAVRAVVEGGLQAFAAVRLVMPQELVPPGLGTSTAPGSDQVLVLAGGGRAALTDGPDGRRWAGISSVWVEPFARGAGLGGVVSETLARWALAEGADALQLQVEDGNEVARRIYARLGFVEHHVHTYWRAPEAGVLPAHQSSTAGDSSPGS